MRMPAGTRKEFPGDGSSGSERRSGSYLASLSRRTDGTDQH